MKKYLFLSAMLVLSATSAYAGQEKLIMTCQSQRSANIVAYLSTSDFLSKYQVHYGNKSAKRFLNGGCSSPFGAASDSFKPKYEELLFCDLIPKPSQDGWAPIGAELFAKLVRDNETKTYYMQVLKVVDAEEGDSDDPFGPVYGKTNKVVDTLFCKSVKK